MIIPSWRYDGKLTPLKSPNRWSCVPSSFAICLGISIEEIIQQIGHDGSEIIFPEMREPLCRRGFHPQEVIKICLRYNYSVMQFDVEPQLITEDYKIYPIADDKDYIQNLLPGNIGALCGYFNDIPHCVCWDGNYILDPNDLIYTLEHFTIQIFYLISKIEVPKHDSISEKNTEID